MHSPSIAAPHSTVGPHVTCRKLWHRCSSQSSRASTAVENSFFQFENSGIINSGIRIPDSGIPRGLREKIEKTAIVATFHYQVLASTCISSTRSTSTSTSTITVSAPGQGLKKLYVVTFVVGSCKLRMVFQAIWLFILILLPQRTCSLAGASVLKNDGEA